MSDPYNSTFLSSGVGRAAPKRADICFLRCFATSTPLHPHIKEALTVIPELSFSSPHGTIPFRPPRLRFRGRCAELCTRLPEAAAPAGGSGPVPGTVRLCLAVKAPQSRARFSAKMTILKVSVSSSSSVYCSVLSLPAAGTSFPSFCCWLCTGYVLFDICVWSYGMVILVQLALPRRFLETNYVKG